MAWGSEREFGASRAIIRWVGAVIAVQHKCHESLELTTRETTLFAPLVRLSGEDSPHEPVLSEDWAGRKHSLCGGSGRTGRRSSESRAMSWRFLTTTFDIPIRCFVSHYYYIIYHASTRAVTSS